MKSEQWLFQDTNLQDTVEPQLSGPRLFGLFDYPDFFYAPVFFMNINKLLSQKLSEATEHSDAFSWILIGSVL